MSSNNYNQYNYPYQQTSAQQYSAYQTAPASNNVAPAQRQYQQPATTQENDYMAYQAQSYSGQSAGYAAGQDNSWNGSSYGGTRETTNRAAEVLRNMSNNSYTPGSTTTNPTNFSTTNSAASQAARYAAGNSQSPRMQPQQPQQGQSTYGQSQNRPRSVNTNRNQQTTSRGLPSPATAVGYPSQQAQTMYNHQQQRSASPAQPQYSNSSSLPTTSVRTATVSSAAPQQYTDYDRRQLASVDASCKNSTAPSTASYNYNNTPTIAPPGPIVPPASGVAETYINQGSITVDPTAVYDPWPEYQRKQEAILAQKAVEDAARAEEERVAEEARKAEEAKKEDERKRQEAQLAASQPRQKAMNAPKHQQSAAEHTPAAPGAPTSPDNALEAEIRAMMAKMRELNGKDPALLARIWEEERRVKAAPKSPTVQNKSAAPTSATASVQLVQANIPQVVNQRKKAAPKEVNNTSATKPATATLATGAPARAQHQAGPNSRSGGSTIWPPEKKTQLAAVAAAYLSTSNSTKPIEPIQVLRMLDGNPSYIELCEQLERMAFKLDRASFAKTLLTAVPDVNSSTRKVVSQPLPGHRVQVPPAIMKKEIATPAAASPSLTPTAATPANTPSYRPFPNNAMPAATPVPVAEMISIKPELKPPANKEEAARKRNLSDLIDMTLLSDDEDIRPPPKRHSADTMYAYGSTHINPDDAMIVDSEPAFNNFPIASVPARTAPEPVPQPAPLPEREVRYVADLLDKKKALRRNNYNPATIARDVLLACGRHPSERQLNQHLEVMRTNLPIGFESDLSTINWDLLDPGKPPPGYFKDSVQALTEDADDEDDSEDENNEARARAQSNAISGYGGAKVQALPEAINPFKPKKRGRPPRHSFPNDSVVSTPKRSPSTADMSASAPRPNAASVGYAAFRSATEYGPDGQPLPKKKKGRPVGWRKAIHGSAAAQSKLNANGSSTPSGNHRPSQPSSLRNVNNGPNEPIRIDSRSPSIANRVARYQSYKCKWQNCSAELHNLETLKKHVFKVHRNQTLRNTLDCLWDDCGKEVVNSDPTTNMTLVKHAPVTFDVESRWRDHIQKRHFDPLSWELGDGPASGLSDAHDSEAYLSDAQGRRVTPRITADSSRAERDQTPLYNHTSASRGRPPKNTKEQEAHEAQERLKSQKKRIGGPGMDRGGATLVNDKRRRGFNDSDGAEEELVDVED